MSDISITAASVVASTGAVIANGISGATITAGKAVYLDTASTGKWLLADCDDASAIVRGSGNLGIALNGASSGQPIAVQTDGDITIGGTLVAGAAYYLSPTAGGICPFADLQTADYVTLIGIAKTTAILTMNKLYSAAVAK